MAGGVEFGANDHVLYRSLIELGTATDVRVRLGRFGARYLDGIVRQVASLPWSRWIDAGQTVEVRAAARRSKIMHTGAIEERILAGIRRAVGSLASDHPEPWRVHARMERDELEISLSMAGRPLHQRGYRKAVSKAPLREDLAHALLSVAGWQPGQALIDPFCGSGTLLIEAARRARGIPPGWQRDFHVQRAPLFDRERWLRIRSRLEEGIRPPGSVGWFSGSDRDAGAIEAARTNADRANVGEDIALTRASVSDAPGLSQVAHHSPGWWISNPPYGDRVRGGDLRPLYQTIGRLFAGLPEEVRLGLLVEDAGLAHATQAHLVSRILLTHGGKKVRLYSNETRAS